MGVKFGYTQTDVGAKPEDWEVRTVGTMGDVRAGKALAARGAGKQRPYLRTKNVFDGRIDLNDVLRMPMTETEFSRYRLQHGDVLLNEGQSLELVGRCAMYKGESPEPCAIQNQLVRFRAREGVSAGFAAQLFRHCQGRGVFTTIALQTTSVAHLGVSRFQKLPLAWPPTRAEQEAIADALSDADALIESLEQLLAKKRQLKQGAMQELLTGKKRLPGFSGEWPVMPLGEVFEFLSTANNPRADLSDAGEVGYIHYGDIHAHTSALLDCAKITLPRIRDAKVAHISRVRNGDLIVADASEDYTGIGKMVEIVNASPRAVVAGLHTFLLRGNPAVVSEGFRGYIQFYPAVRASLVRLATGISVFGISKDNLRSIEFRLPSLEEQTALAAILSDMDAEIAALGAKLAKARQLKQGMMQELLAGTIRLV